MNTSLTWEDIGAVVGIATTVAGIGMVLIRDRLRREFALRTELVEAVTRQEAVTNGLTEGYRLLERSVHAIEIKLGAVPTHDDMREVFRRMAAVEVGVAGVQSSMTGVEQHLADLVKDVRMLVNHEIKKDT